MTMRLQNVTGPFVDEKLAVQLGRVVVSYKYPIAVLAPDAHDVLDRADAWLVTFKVTRWTEAAKIFGGISTIPLLIRKRDGAWSTSFHTIRRLINLAPTLPATE